jgi:diadenosine tetraphosphate (Ap4A) HIT family hydrolase
MSAQQTCPFCQPEAVLLQNELAFALFDRSPVTPGHMLLIPRRHVADWFETTADERVHLMTLADEARAVLIQERRPDGFNLGVNVGMAAGQTVFHVHLHLIPRYVGDVANPRGGVRGVIPAMQNYDRL